MGTHVPVQLVRCLELLSPALERPGAIHLDATLGLGGHAEAVLAAHPKATVVGLDRDGEALDLAGRRLEPFGDRVHLVQAVYDEIPEILDDLGFDHLDSALFDLGVSSLQLDEAGRGFSYAREAPLDMRMDRSTGMTAEQVVNTYSVGELARVMRVYGEERFAGRIAAAVVRERQLTPITSSARLAKVIADAIPAPARRTGGNPAKRTFQALRIEVNAELAVLERALPAALDALVPGGRMAVLSYHSLEDRMVKRAFAERVTSKAPPGLPVEPVECRATFRLLTRGAETASEAERVENPRASSSRLRAVERI